MNELFVDFPLYNYLPIEYQKSLQFCIRNDTDRLRENDWKSRENQEKLELDEIRVKDYVWLDWRRLLVFWSFSVMILWCPWFFLVSLVYYYLQRRRKCHGKLFKVIHCGLKIVEEVEMVSRGYHVMERGSLVPISRLDRRRCCSFLRKQIQSSLVKLQDHLMNSNDGKYVLERYHLPDIVSLRHLNYLFGVVKRNTNGMFWGKQDCLFPDYSYHKMQDICLEETRLLNQSLLQYVSLVNRKSEGLQIYQFGNEMNNSLCHAKATINYFLQAPKNEQQNAYQQIQNEILKSLNLLRDHGKQLGLESSPKIAKLSLSVDPGRAIEKNHEPNSENQESFIRYDSLSNEPEPKKQPNHSKQTQLEIISTTRNPKKPANQPKNIGRIFQLPKTTHRLQLTNHTPIIETKQPSPSNPSSICPQQQGTKQTFLEEMKTVLQMREYPKAIDKKIQILQENGEFTLVADDG